MKAPALWGCPSSHHTSLPVAAGTLGEPSKAQASFPIPGSLCPHQPSQNSVLESPELWGCRVKGCESPGSWSAPRIQDPGASCAFTGLKKEFAPPLPLVGPRPRLRCMLPLHSGSPCAFLSLSFPIWTVGEGPCRGWPLGGGLVLGSGGPRGKSLLVQAAPVQRPRGSDWWLREEACELELSGQGEWRLDLEA